jgi:hypothetical protein
MMRSEMLKGLAPTLPRATLLSEVRGTGRRRVEVEQGGEVTAHRMA